MDRAQLATEAVCSRQARCGVDAIGLAAEPALIIAIEQGKYSPSLELAFQLSRLFGMTIDDLFEYPTDAPDGVSA